MSETELTDAPPPTGDETASAEKRRSGIIYKLRKRAYRKFPSLIPDPDYKDHLASYQKGDDEENLESEPPKDECIDLRCIWAVELYTPAHIDNLLAGFRSLGWDKEDPTLRGRNPALWVQSLRESAYGVGWFNLGLISRQKERRFPWDGRTAPLPEQVEHAYGEIHSLTSSITCVVVGFVLKEEHSRVFEQALRQKRATNMMRIERGYRIHGPRSQKEKAIRAIRIDMQAMAAGWFRTYLPGLFSSGILVDEFPTCEFVTLRRGQPFPKREQGSAMPEEYLRLLNIDHDIDAWVCSDIPGLKFAWPALRDRDKRFHAILAINESDFPEELLRGYGGDERFAYVSSIDRCIKGLLSRWALLALLSAFERHLNAVRDSAILRQKEGAEALGLLETLGKHVSQSVDISAVSAELGRYTENPRSFGHEVEKFKPSNPRLHGEIILHEALREQIGKRAAWLQDADHSVRDLLIQYGTMLGARENIKLQGSVGRLTVFIAFLTLLMAFLALHQAWPDIVRWFSWIRTRLF